jgi:hypothetical protein
MTNLEQGNELFATMWLPGCVCAATYRRPYECVCPRAEAGIRWVAEGRSEFTEEQREWCLDEIGQVEGYERGDYEGDSDDEIAKETLHAWTDYCRDKGLL